MRETLFCPDDVFGGAQTTTEAEMGTRGGTRGSRSRPVRVPAPSFTPPQHPPLASPSH
jgi:hypothetical protein